MSDDLLREVSVYPYPAGVDQLIECPEVLFRCIRCELNEPLPDTVLRNDILCIVSLEQLPLFRRVLRIVPSPSAVALGRLARLAEILYERLSDLVLLFVRWKLESLADGRQRHRKTELCGKDHRATPLCRV